MEAISLKLEESFLKDMENIMKRHRYTTKTEFIREAIRDKMKEIEKEEALRRLEANFGASKRRTTEEQIEKAKENAWKSLLKKRGLSVD